jgi:TetR/AcrR family transcriptional repressor of bet genes
MKRTRIRDIRNQEFISATLSATFERGFHAVTMADIARKLGATAASINYYFGSKDRLMAETMTHLLGLLRQEHVMALSQAHTPKERLRAIVEANFSDAFFTPEHCTFWVQFWSAAPYSQSLTRLQTINRARVRSHFRHELKHLTPVHTRETIRRLIQSYMDGVWVSVAQGERKVNAPHARQEAFAMIDLVLR